MADIHRLPDRQADPEKITINLGHVDLGRIDLLVREQLEGRDVTQLAATSRALDRAGFAILSSGLQQCLATKGSVEGEDAKTLEKLFLTLS